MAEVAELSAIFNVAKVRTCHGFRYAADRDGLSGFEVVLVETVEVGVVSASTPTS